jgi:hypothetical protein
MAPIRLETADLGKDFYVVSRPKPEIGQASDQCKRIGGLPFGHQLPDWSDKLGESFKP